jgi:hypothetical protein
MTISFNYCKFAATLVAASLLASEASAQRGGGYSPSSVNATSGGMSSSSRLPFSGSNRGGSGGYGALLGTSPSGGQVSGMGSLSGLTGGGFGQQVIGGPANAGGLMGNGAGQLFQQGGFVGRDAEDVRGSFERTSGRDRRSMMMDMMIENYNESRESRRRWRDQQNAVPPVRVRLQPAAELAAAAAVPRAMAPVQARLNQLLAARGIGAEVEIAGGTAILRGAVATERDVLLAAQLAALEPGVSNVQSELTVAPSAAP